MVTGVRGCVVGAASLGALAMLAGCSGLFFAQREPWRHEAEAQCLSAGLVTESAGIVRLSPIQGAGVCGADFPFKVSAVGNSASMVFADDPRPPGSIPSGAPIWPIAKPSRQDPPPPYPERR